MKNNLLLSIIEASVCVSLISPKRIATYCDPFFTIQVKGVLRTEGKEYIVKDGDVVEFKI